MACWLSIIRQPKPAFPRGPVLNRCSDPSCSTSQADDKCAPPAIVQRPGERTANMAFAVERFQPEMLQYVHPLPNADNNNAGPHNAQLPMAERVSIQEWRRQASLASDFISICARVSVLPPAQRLLSPELDDPLSVSIPVLNVHPTEHYLLCPKKNGLIGFASASAVEMLLLH